MKAIWHNTTIADSNQTVVVEGNHYFPADHVEWAYLEPSEHHTTCPWKGVASYYHIIVAGERNPDAAWYYPEPNRAAEDIRGLIAFWRGVQVLP